jgi:ketosteroid isomerase-like protein
LKKIVLLLVLPLFYSFQSSLDIPKIKNEIQTVLEQQKILWNEGDIEGFMEYYWNSEDFTFQSGNTRLQGWQALLSRYKNSYSGENMGKLDFTDIRIKALSNDIVYVLGRWKLILKDSSKEGLFTLIFQRITEGWKIIHDHTS